MLGSPSLRLIAATAVAWACVWGGAPPARAADPAASPAASPPPSPASPASPPASSPASSELPDEVDRHAALAERHLEHGRYQDAIAEFRRAYELRAEPRLLLGIGDAYRLLGIVDRALFFYERYLAALPDDALDRPDVEKKISELESVRARAAAAAPAPALAPSLARDVVIVPVGPSGSRRADDGVGPPPLWRRWWFWTALGGAVAAGVLAGLALGSRDDAGPPATALGDKRFY